MMKDHNAGKTWSRCVSLAAGFLFLCAASCCGVADAQPLTLEQCVEQGLANNPGLAAARFDVKGAQAKRLGASGAFLPSLSLQSGFTHSESGPGSFVFEGIRIPLAASKKDYYSLRGNLSQNILHLPSLYRYQATGAEVAFSTEDMRSAQADLVHQIRQQYYLLLKAILLADVAKDALAVSEEQLRKSEALFELGSVKRTDVLSARVNRAKKVQEEISARNAIETEKARLAVLLGLPVREPLEIRLDVADPPAAEPPDEGILIETALKDRPEVRGARARVTAANRYEDAAFWEQFPTLAGSANYSKQANQFDALIAPDEIKDEASWGFSIGLNWMIFDGFGSIGGVRGAKAVLAAAHEESRRQELEAALAVREARIMIKDASEGIRAAEEAVELAAENLKLQQALYENGGGTILELNNAQVEHTSARNSLVEARISLHVAYAGLDRALGR